MDQTSRLITTDTLGLEAHSKSTTVVSLALALATDVTPSSRARSELCAHLCRSERFTPFSEANVPREKQRVGRSRRARSADRCDRGAAQTLLSWSSAATRLKPSPSALMRYCGDVPRGGMRASTTYRLGWFNRDPTMFKDTIDPIWKLWLGIVFPVAARRRDVAALRNPSRRHPSASTTRPWAHPRSCTPS